MNILLVPLSDTSVLGLGLRPLQVSGSCLAQGSHLEDSIEAQLLSCKLGAVSQTVNFIG